ncbi:MAG: hypothetical protein KIT17_01120 [Rubrivivax sp.]|nr:hypothetical protein [Rubrivivax sp.]
MTKPDPLVPNVKQLNDRKGPLKGKGGSLIQASRWRGHAQLHLQQVHAAMEELAAKSRSITGRTFGLHVYSLRDGRQLRWRLTCGRHATWQRIEPMLELQPAGLARWYGKAQEQALILNHREQALRYEVKTVDRLIELSAALPSRAFAALLDAGW